MRARLSGVALLLPLLLSGATALGGSGTATEDVIAEVPRFILITHVSAEAGKTTIGKAALAAIFLGRVTRWSDGSAIRPVDLSFTDPLRAAFCEDVLGQNLEALKAYWQRALVQGGASPPLAKASEAEVVDFVKRTQGAIGYVSPDAPLADGVRILKYER